MYRLLEVGEVIENGDEYYWNNRWNSIVPSCFGCKVKAIDSPIRRLVKPAVTPAASIVPAPVVSVGDRVKVLSGPWAGCTGVVIGSLPMNLKIKMDNVFVGGNNLTMIVGKTSSVEPLPPVVPEVLFRDLSHGEMVRVGDQYWLYGMGPWETVKAGSSLIGDTLKPYKARHRRAVRVQSPGWRYLDAGETIQAGDETEYSVPPIWRCASGCSSYLGRVFEGHDKFFRRKLPANQGG